MKGREKILCTKNKIWRKWVWRIPILSLVGKSTSSLGMEKALLENPSKKKRHPHGVIQSLSVFGCDPECHVKSG